MKFGCYTYFKDIRRKSQKMIHNFDFFYLDRDNFFNIINFKQLEKLYSHFSEDALVSRSYNFDKKCYNRPRLSTRQSINSTFP